MKKFYLLVNWLHGCVPAIVCIAIFAISINALYAANSTEAQTENEKKISISFDGADLETILLHIKNVSGYYVVYNSAVVKSVKNISIHRNATPVEDILKTCLKGTDLTYTINNNTIVIKNTPPQTTGNTQITTSSLSELTGVVSSLETRRPIVGVTVYILGEDGNIVQGTISNVKGEYRLKIDPNLANQLIMFSFIGLETQKIPYKKQLKIDVRLKDIAENISEIVVTGYQKIDRRDMVGSYTTVSTKDIMMPAMTSIDQMLQGRVAGMMVTNSSSRVGTSPKITIRGTSTLLGNTDPLWVVDGIIQPDALPFDASKSLTEDLNTMLGNQISWLNPNDIENVTVLKDASATAVYGSKASNGVIVITTKKGLAGRVSVNYTHNSSLRLAPRYKDFNVMNSQERLLFSQEAFAEGMKYATPPIGEQNTYEGLMALYLDNKMTEAEFNTKVKRLETGNTDWLDLLTRNSYSQNHNVSVAGGSDKVTYNVSASYNNNKGVERGNDSRGMSGRAYVNAQLHPKVQLAASLSASSTKNNGFVSSIDPLNYAVYTSRSIPAFEENGDQAYYLRLGDYKGIENSPYLGYNIMNESKYTSSLSQTDQVNAALNFNWKIMPWLEYQFVGGYSISNTSNESYADERSFHIASKYRGYLYGDVEPNSAEFYSAILPFGGEFNTNSGESRSYDIQNKVLFAKTINQDHRINALAGFQIRSNESINRTNTIWGFSKSRGETVTPPTAPDKFNPINGGAIEDGSWGIFDKLYDGTKWNHKSQIDNYVSVFATFAYSYRNRYVFNANMRTDASNRFGQDFNKRFDPTYSFGASWRIAEENFMKDNVPWIDQMNLRVSYGIQGNVVNNVSPDLILSRLGIQMPYNEEVSQIVSLPNPLLKYESTETINIGLDLQLFKGITMVLEYYNRESNAIMGQLIPQENGQNKMNINGGNINNQGVEYTINFTPFQRKNFAWTVGINISKNWNGVNYSTPKDRQILSGEYINGSNAYMKQGYPLNGFWSYRFAGLDPKTGGPTFNGVDLKPEDFSGDPSEFLVYSGEKTPYLTSGINTHVRYKSFSFSADFALLLGSKMRLPSPYANIMHYLPGATENLNKNLLKRWKNPGDERYTIYPALSLGTYNKNMTIPDNTAPLVLDMWAKSDAMVVSGGFFRCRQMMFSWDMPATYCSKIGISSLVFNISANNLFVIADKRLDGFDPELGGNGVQPRIFSLGLSLGF